MSSAEDPQPRRTTPIPLSGTQSRHRQASATPIRPSTMENDLDNIPHPDSFSMKSVTRSKNNSPKNSTKTSHHQQHQPAAVGSAENFFRQHISFVHDQPSDPDFVPSPTWFGQHSQEEFSHLIQTPGSSKIDRVHQRRLLMTNNNNTTTTGTPTTNRARQTAAFSSSFTPPIAGSQNRVAKNAESLQESLNALRRRQAIRSVLENEIQQAGANNDDDDDDGFRSADYWLSPSQQEESERRIRSSKTLLSQTVNNNNNNSNNFSSSRRPVLTNDGDRSHRAPPTVVQKLKAFTSAQEFSEELVFALCKDLFSSLVAGVWLLLKKFASWIYGLGYFMIFGVAAPTKSNDTNSTNIDSATKVNPNQQSTTGNQNVLDSSKNYPSPFPGFYRDAFFSTWSPHELLEPKELQMTNAFLPTRGIPPGVTSAQQAAEMLRPSPAPPFWWLGLMEISGRHFIETQWAQHFARIMEAAARECRNMWMLNEIEVLRGEDLIRRVTQRGGIAVEEPEQFDDDDDG